jgi:hypothetical protein
VQRESGVEATKDARVGLANNSKRAPHTNTQTSVTHLPSVVLVEAAGVHSVPNHIQDDVAPVHIDADNHRDPGTTLRLRRGIDGTSCKCQELLLHVHR